MNTSRRQDNLRSFFGSARTVLRYQFSDHPSPEVRGGIQREASEWARVDRARAQTSRNVNNIPRRLMLIARSVLKVFAGHISRIVLLRALLPLSFASLLGTLIIAAYYFPTGYDWRVRAISNLTSPRHNPHACWLPAIGTTAAMLLALPFAGYLAHRLHAVTPRLAWSAGLAFAFSFGLMLVSVAAQFAEPAIGLPWLHQFLAGAAAAGFILGMLCCCACAVKDRLLCLGGQLSLPAALVFWWGSLTLLPMGSLASMGILMALSHLAGQTWAEDLRQSFRHTPLWQLAFWEWIGAAVAFAFLIGSVVLLPVSYRDRERESVGTDSLWRG